MLVFEPDPAPVPGLVALVGPDLGLVPALLEAPEALRAVLPWMIC